MSAAAMLAGAAPDQTPDWHSIEWRKVWQTVRRLQARIVKAVAQGRWNKVKALVYLLTHSFGGRALAILRVVSNSGAKTPGVDGVLWNTPEAKSAAFNTLRRHGYQPQPLRRVYIPSYRGGKVLLKPSSRNVKTFLAKIQETIDRSGSQTAGELIRRLNQQIKGWTMYHRYASSKRTFSSVDHRIFQKVWRWCRRRHPKKSKKWIKEKYFLRDGHRHWVFTGTLRDPKGQGWPIQLMAAAR